jgi:hypothetical protein
VLAKYIWRDATSLHGAYIRETMGKQTVCEGVFKSFRTGRLERELKMVQLSATRCSCIAILWARLVSFAAITLCVASQRMFIVVSKYFFMIQSGNFWIHPRMKLSHFGSVRIEVKFYPFLTEHHARKTYWGSGGVALRILNIGTGRRPVVSSTPPAALPHWVWNPNTHCTGGWMGPRACLEALAMRKCSIIAPAGSVWP